ncbi:MAG TPA: hypothetical protein VJ165_05215 [candidate division Zixibacteria bacterium]|nr:hypothetical protein [candidate division Zixibacteria bacterium]
MKIRLNCIKLGLILSICLFANSLAQLTPEQKKKLDAHMIMAYGIYSRSDTTYVENGIRYVTMSLSVLTQIIEIDTTVSPFTIVCFISTTGSCDELSVIPGVTLRGNHGGLYTAKISVDKIPEIARLDCVNRMEASTFTTILSPPSSKYHFDDKWGKIFIDESSKKWYYKASINLLARLYFLEKSKAKVETVDIYVFLTLPLKWSKHITTELEARGLKDVKKINDYLVEGKVNINQIEQLLTSGQITSARLKDESNMDEVLEFCKRISEFWRDMAE